MHGLLHMSAEARAAFDRVVPLARRELAGASERDVDVFVIRLERWWPDLWAGLQAPYGARPDLDRAVDRLVGGLAARYRQRADDLKRLDLERSITPDWFQDPPMIGYVCYADRFAGTLAGVQERLDYLQELSVRYLHLMPLLRPRPGDSDGGYAVADYRAVDPRLGTMDDLERLCRGLRERGISLCTDLVLNHCAAEQEWAVRAARGEPEYEELFWIFPDRTLPDEYEKTLPVVFPEVKPGNFTQIPGTGKWVWTSFYSFQWDLNWSNPEVFLRMTDILLELANRGVEVFRLDAVGFIWKRLGTSCQSQPEVHNLIQALRACARVVAPAIVFKAEAIFAPADLVFYLGVGRHHGKVSDLAYHNSLMTQFWAALATGDTRLATGILGDFPDKPPSTAWATYIRNHDDVPWIIPPEYAEAAGLDHAAHRAWLADFYAGKTPGSDARGAVFQANPVTGDRRTSGSTASLAGLEVALERGDPELVDRAVRRILLGYTLIMGWDGVPLIYMGDELGMLNDASYLDDPALAGDNRWMHRPRMDWAKAARHGQEGTVEQRIFEGIRHLIRIRQHTPHLHAATLVKVLDLGNPALLGFVRRHPIGPLLAVHNFSDRAQHLDGGMLAELGLADPHDRITGRPAAANGAVPLAPYQAVWLTDPDSG